MKRMCRIFGNALAGLAGVATALLALYSVGIVVYADQFYAWAAVGICVAWFVALVIRKLTKECRRVE